MKETIKKILTGKKHPDKIKTIKRLENIRRIRDTDVLFGKEPLNL